MNNANKDFSADAFAKTAIASADFDSTPNRSEKRETIASRHYALNLRSPFCGLPLIREIEG